MRSAAAPPACRLLKISDIFRNGSAMPARRAKKVSIALWPIVQALMSNQKSRGSDEKISHPPTIITSEKVAMPNTSVIG